MQTWYAEALRHRLHHSRDQVPTAGLCIVSAVNQACLCHVAARPCNRADIASMLHSWILPQHESKGIGITHKHVRHLEGATPHLQVQPVGNPKNVHVTSTEQARTR